jgi:hypothetical protein
MKKLSSLFEYPIVVKQVNGMLTFSVPDLNIFLATTAPTSKDLSRDYVTEYSSELGKKIIQAWGKINAELKKHESVKWRPPEVSRIKNTVSREKKVKEILLISDLVEILSMSENSIRRISPQDLPYFKTSGGHRRYKKIHVELFLIKLEENKLEKQKKSKFHIGLRKKLKKMEAN